MLSNPSPIPISPDLLSRIEKYFGKTATMLILRILDELKNDDVTPIGSIEIIEFIPENKLSKKYIAMLLMHVYDYEIGYDLSAKSLVKIYMDKKGRVKAFHRAIEDGLIHYDEGFDFDNVIVELDLVIARTPNGRIEILVAKRGSDGDIAKLGLIIAKQKHVRKPVIIYGQIE